MELLPGESKIGHYIFEKRLGSGAFATVWLATHEITHIKVAVKIIVKSSINDDEAVTRLTRELNFMKQMRHPFIAEFYEYLEDDQAHYYCMEYAEHESLLNFISTNGPLSEAQVRHYFSQLVSVLEYLHNDLRVCHRDVKAENILLDRHNNIRVIDFGLANQFTASRPLLNTACGSPPYASPEMIKGQPYSQASDIWSSGIVLYSMATGLLPFDDDNLQTLLRKIVTAEIVYPAFLSPALTDLLKRMLTKNPDLRLTLAEIKEHDWFSQTQYEALFAMHLGERSTETIVDLELLDQMAEFGIETSSLKQQLFLGAFTELTAMYRMLRRQRLTDKMRDVVARLLNGGRRLSAARSMPVPGRRLSHGKVTPVAPAPHTGEPSAANGKHPGAPVAMERLSPIPVQSGGRRFSRPLAVPRGYTAPRSRFATAPPEST
jgi:serine/threonine protein kinase